MGDFGSALQRLLSSTRKLDDVMESATLTAALAEEDYAPPRDGVPYGEILQRQVRVERRPAHR